MANANQLVGLGLHVHLVANLSNGALLKPIFTLHLTEPLLSWQKKDSMLLMCSPFEQKVVTAGQENRPTSLQVSMATAATLGAVEGGAKLSCSTYTK